MGKTVRRKQYGSPVGGVTMRERKEQGKPSEWYAQRKDEKRITNKLRKLKR